MQKVHDETFDMTRNGRWELITKKRICRTCLFKHSRICPISKRCGVDGCMRYHHALLHGNFKNNNEAQPIEQAPTPQAGPSKGLVSTPPTPQAGSSKGLVSTHHSDQSILYRILPVYLYGREKKIKTFAFIDEGSSITLVEEKIAAELDLDGPPSDLCLRWTNDISRVEENSKRVNIDISGVHSNSKMFKMHGVNTVKHLQLPSQTVNEETLVKFDYLKRLPITCFENGKPTIIIGLDNYKLVMPLSTKSGKWEDPIASKTYLGWTIHGVHRHPSNEVRLNLHRCDCSNKENSDLNSLVETF